MTEPTKKPTCNTLRSPGRPRSEAARQAILSAAYELLQEKALPEITSTAIAKRAGVSKATLYRWWPSKEVIVLEGYFEAVDALIAVPETDDALADLRAHMRRVYAAMAGPDGAIFATLVASGHFNADVRAALDDRLNSPRCQETTDILTRAMDDGQLSSDLDVELVTSLLFGPLFERLMTGEPVATELPDRILTLVLSGLRGSTRED